MYMRQLRTQLLRLLSCFIGVFSESKGRIRCLESSTVLHLTTFVPHCLNCNVPLLREHQNLCIQLLVLRVAVARCVRVFDRASTTVQRGRRGYLERSSGEASVARGTRVRLDAVLLANLWSTSCYREDGGPRPDIRSVSHRDQSNGSDRSFLDELRPGQRDA